MKDLRRQFKKRSIALLPEKHPSLANAHSRFEELNAAFVKVRLLFCVQTILLQYIHRNGKAVQHYATVKQPRHFVNVRKLVTITKNKAYNGTCVALPKNIGLRFSYCNYTTIYGSEIK
jgi:hypothetical protein